MRARGEWGGTADFLARISLENGLNGTATDAVLSGRNSGIASPEFKERRHKGYTVGDAFA